MTEVVVLHLLMLAKLFWQAYSDGMATIEIDKASLAKLASDLESVAVRLRALLQEAPKKPLARNDDTRVAAAMLEDTCLSCDKPALTRGLCYTHREQVKRLIESGEYTENEVIEAGWMFPEAKKGRKPKGAFIQAIGAAATTNAPATATVRTSPLDEFLDIEQDTPPLSASEQSALDAASIPDVPGPRPTQKTTKKGRK